MRLIERIREQGQGVEQRYAIDDWLTQYLFPSTFQYGNTTYNFGMPGGLQTTMGEVRVKAIASSLPAYTSALKSCPPAFAAQMVRALVLSQARFTFRNPPWAENAPRKTFGTPALQPLERPWPKATTGDMVGLMEWHEGLAGNSFVTRRPQQLKVLRPDWVAMVYGTDGEPDPWADYTLDGQLLGYIYQPGGIGHADTEPTWLRPDDVAHWISPGLEDPECPGRGMSWITPGIRDIQGDQAASEFKLKYLSNGATPNLVVKGIPAYNPKQFNEFVDMMEERHAGLANAFKTLYLVAGADASVVGSNLKDLEFSATQGAGETRISMLSRVPAPVLGIAAGLEGSSLNAGNFGQARRLFADTWVYPSLQNLAQTLEDVIDVPSRAELWFDALDIPLLKEDARDAAEINSVRAQTIRTLVDGGFTWDSAAAYADSGDVRVLKHTGLFSVQLQKPGAQVPAITSGGQS